MHCHTLTHTLTHIRCCLQHPATKGGDQKQDQSCWKDGTCLLSAQVCDRVRKERREREEEGREGRGGRTDGRGMIEERGKRGEGWKGGRKRRGKMGEKDD